MVTSVQPLSRLPLIPRTRRAATCKPVTNQHFWIIRKMLHEVETGWHWLERTLNEVIRAVNQQKPLPSATIAIEESPNGTLLKVVGQGQDQGPPSGGGGGGSGGTGPVTWHNVGWMT